MNLFSYLWGARESTHANSMTFLVNAASMRKLKTALKALKMIRSRPLKYSSVCTDGRLSTVMVILQHDLNSAYLIWWCSIAQKSLFQRGGRNTGGYNNIRLGGLPRLTNAQHAITLSELSLSIWCKSSIWTSVDLLGNLLRQINVTTSFGEVEMLLQMICANMTWPF